MTIREARFGNDVLGIAEVLNSKCKGKSDISICRSRADQCVKRSIRSKGRFCKSLVAEKNGEITGFLYAEENQAFELLPKIRFVEVHFLAGKGSVAVPLLRELRSMTNKRILIHFWALSGRSPKAFQRLIGSLAPQPVGTTYQL